MRYVIRENRALLPSDIRKIREIEVNYDLYPLICQFSRKEISHIMCFPVFGLIQFDGCLCKALGVIDVSLKMNRNPRKKLNWNEKAVDLTLGSEKNAQWVSDKEVRWHLQIDNWGRSESVYLMRTARYYIPPAVLEYAKYAFVIACMVYAVYLLIRIRRKKRTPSS
jgi:hypothetical protein